MSERRILLTRPADRANAFAASLVEDGWVVTNWPLTEIRPLSADEALPPNAQAVLYTSRAGVEHGAGELGALPAYCVGAATAAAARSAGHRDVMCADGAAPDLIALVQTRLSPADGMLIHPRGRDVAGDVAGALSAVGFTVEERIVYEAVAATEAPPAIAADIIGAQFHAVAFFSPRASMIFGTLAQPGWRTGLSAATAYAISENAAAPLAKLPFGAIKVAKAPNAAALRAAICGAA